MYELNKTFTSGNYNITEEDRGIFDWGVQITGGYPQTLHFLISLEYSFRVANATLVLLKKISQLKRDIRSC